MLGDLLLADEEDQEDTHTFEKLIEPGPPILAAQHHHADVLRHGPHEPADRQHHDRCKNEWFHWLILIGATRRNIAHRPDLAIASCDRAQPVTHSWRERACACVTASP